MRSGYSSSTSIRPYGHARSDAPELQAGGTTTPGQGRCARREGPAAEWSPPDERAPRHLFEFVPDRCQVEFTHSSRSGLPLASCVSGRACALFWCHVPRRFNSFGVLIVSIPTNPLSSKKVPRSDDEQAQQRPSQLRSSRQSPALSGHLRSCQVVAFLTGPCMPKFLCQRNVAVGGERSGEHGNMGNSARRGKGPLESNGIRIWRFPLRVPPADREATTSSFQKSFDGDASTFASYFIFFNGAPRIDGRMVASANSLLEVLLLPCAPLARGDRGHSATSCWVFEGKRRVFVTPGGVVVALGRRIHSRMPWV